MSLHSPHRIVSAILALAFISAAATAQADWSHDSRENNPVANSYWGEFKSSAVPDGQGGLLIGYLDYSNFSGNVVVQRLDADGNPQWGSTGVSAHEDFGFMDDFELISDGSGGAFLAIQDSHDGANNHVYVQHVTAAGVAAWGTQGINAAPAVSTVQEAATLCLDGTGGVIVAFYDLRGGGSSDIYGQHFDVVGNRLWTDSGKGLCMADQDQNLPRLVYGGNNGFYMTWLDRRDLAINGDDIYTNLYDFSGNPLWTINGEQTCGLASNQFALQIVLDAQGGVIVAWADYRNAGTSNSDIFAQRYLPNGSEIWTTNGQGICNEVGGQGNALLVADRFGGAFFAWEDSRTDSYTGTTIYVQSVGADGNLLWNSAGLVAGGGNGNQQDLGIALTTDDNFAVFWEDFRNPYTDIYAQLFTDGGTRMCDYYGKPISSASRVQDLRSVVADRTGGAYSVFDDTRSQLNYDVYMQRLDRTGVLGDPAANISRLIDQPLDQGGKMLLDWTHSWLDGYQEPGIFRYSLWRRFPGGSTPGSAVLPPVTDKGLSAADLVALQQAGWNYIDAVIPAQFTEYGYLVPTFADSTEAGAPLTEYMVLTESSFGNIESDIVGGWSVDNLAPGAPLVLNITLVGPDATLAWTPSGYRDEDLLQYNLYRAATPNVTPGSLNLVASSPDTVAIDMALPGGPWYYVVTAVDIHGNEGEPSNEVMVQSVSAVAENQFPRATSIRFASPNPFNPRTSIKYGVPTTSAVRLTVYDLRGQKIATLVEQVMAAGFHTVEWNGRAGDGRQVPSGIYFARLEAAGTEATFKLVLAK